MNENHFKQWGIGWIVIGVWIIGIVSGYMTAYTVCNKTADEASLAILKQARKMLEQDEKVLNQIKEVKAQADEVLNKANEKIDYINKVKRLYEYEKRKNPKLTYNQGIGFTALVLDWCREENIEPYHVFAYFQIENDFNLTRKGDGGKSLGPGQVQKEVWDLYKNKFGYKDNQYHLWECNSRVSVAFAADLFRRYKSWDIAIRYYNGGGNHFQKKSVNQHIKKYWTAYREIQKYMSNDGVIL